MTSNWNDRIRIDGGAPGAPLSITVSVAITGSVTSVEGTPKGNGGSLTYFFERGTQDAGFDAMSYSLDVLSGPGFPTDLSETFVALSYTGGVLTQRFDLEYGAFFDIRSRLSLNANEGGSAATTGSTGSTSIAFGLPPGATLTSDSGFAYATPEPDAIDAALVAFGALGVGVRRRSRRRSSRAWRFVR